MESSYTLAIFIILIIYLYTADQALAGGDDNDTPTVITREPDTHEYIRLQIPIHKSVNQVDSCKTIECTRIQLLHCAAKSSAFTAFLALLCLPFPVGNCVAGSCIGQTASFMVGAEAASSEFYNVDGHILSSVVSGGGGACVCASCLSATLPIVPEAPLVYGCVCGLLAPICTECCCRESAANESDKLINYFCKKEVDPTD